MAAPSLRGTGTADSYPVGTADVPFVLPATVEAGDRLLLLCGMRGGAPGSIPTVTVRDSGGALLPGWISRASDGDGSSFHVLEKIADGTEDGATVYLRRSESASLSVLCYVVQGAHASQAAQVFVDHFYGGNPINLAEQTISWGAGETFAIGAISYGTSNYTGAPAGYTSLGTYWPGIGPTMSVATREVPTSTEDQGAWPSSDGGGQGALILIRPVSSAATLTPTPATLALAAGGANGTITGVTRSIAAAGAKTVTATSSAPGVATVSGSLAIADGATTSTGSVTVTPVAAGNATITLQESGGGPSTTVAVSVSAPSTNVFARGVAFAALAGGTLPSVSTPIRFLLVRGLWSAASFNPATGINSTVLTLNVAADGTVADFALPAGWTVGERWTLLGLEGDGTQAINTIDLLYDTGLAVT